ncbi:hypothetical protein HOU00_gp068 [Caulobacter phage CcrPW]|uniref:Uncharacterized protein n=1 Tax=Caulobacter phage CcrPW TaxID=2283271 RepID=A0A385ECR4_9CAUD|nr:hypothetical protein HOU00_gp068 [Caulobacter phage CcrPW]AXQ68607.1 hypothetical protein CcrPW_gp068 [Caulobacter phage CcrPW]
MIALHQKYNGRLVYLQPDQIKAVEHRASGDTAVIVEGIDDTSPWIVVETPEEIAKLLAGWKWRPHFLNETIRDGAVITALRLDLKTKGLVPTYAHLHLEQVH